MTNLMVVQQEGVGWLCWRSGGVAMLAQCWGGYAGTVSRTWVSLCWSVTRSLSFQCVGFVVQLLPVDILLSLNALCDFLEVVDLGLSLQPVLHAAGKKKMCVGVHVYVRAKKDVLNFLLFAY